MKKNRAKRFVTAAMVLLAAVLPSAIGAAPGFERDPNAGWAALPDLPDALGVAGCFAGASGGALLVAGGANFADKMPWEGGTKVWHDSVYALPTTGGTWQAVGRLPMPLGYGVAFAVPAGLAAAAPDLRDSLICAGGSQAGGHVTNVFRLRWAGGKLDVAELPPLPLPLANTCGALLDSTLYIAGGIPSPDATAAAQAFLALDLARPENGWRALDPWPGPGRMLAMAGVQEKSFFLAGGVALSPDAAGKPARAYLSDAYRFAPGKGWRQIAALPHPLAGGASPGASVGAAHLLFFGGDDGAKVGFMPREQHPGFNPEILAYHTITDTWTPMGVAPAARATLPVARWGKSFVMVSGEQRPGVRSPQVWAFTPVVHRKAFGAVNYATFAVYPVIMMAIAWWVGRKSSSDEFFRGGKRIPWWAAGLSIYATMLSSITFMAIPAKAYATDWAFFLGIVSMLIITPIVIRFYLPFYRQLDITSPYEYLERRFNLAARWFGAVSFIVLQLGRTAIVLYLPALALSTVSNFATEACILGMGLICILMTFQGGLESVVWTDVAQTVILMVGAIAMLGIALAGVPGGLGGVWTLAQADHKILGGLDWSTDLAAATVWVILLGSLFQNLSSYTTGQDLVQRFVSVPDTRQAARSIWTNALMSVGIQPMFFLLGTALYAFYKTHPGNLDPTLQKTDAVFSLFIVNELPVGLAGLVVAAIFAAAQPTSSLNSIATTWVTDFKARLNPATPDGARLRLAKVVTIASGVLGTALALAMTRADFYSTWDLFLALLGLTGSALAALFALGIFTTRATGKGAVAGTIASVGLLVWIKYNTTLHFFTYSIIGFVVCIGVGYLASLVLPADRKSLEGLTLFTRRRTEHREESAPSKQGLR